MPEGPLFTVLDDVAHVIAEDETTSCGLIVPQGNGFTTGDVPDDLCPICAKENGLEVPKKAKRGAKA